MDFLVSLLTFFVSFNFVSSFFFVLCKSCPSCIVLLRFVLYLSFSLSLLPLSLSLSLFVIEFLHWFQHKKWFENSLKSICIMMEWVFNVSEWCNSKHWTWSKTQKSKEEEEVENELFVYGRTWQEKVVKWKSISEEDVSSIISYFPMNFRIITGLRFVSSSLSFCLFTVDKFTHRYCLVCETTPSLHYCILHFTLPSLSTPSKLIMYFGERDMKEEY